VGSSGGLTNGICCLIQSTYELGVEATFWGTEEVAESISEPVEVDEVEAWAWV